MFGEHGRKYGNKWLAISALVTLAAAIFAAWVNDQLGNVDWLEVGYVVVGALTALGVLGSRANGVASEEVKNNPMNPANDLPVPKNVFVEKEGRARVGALATLVMLIALAMITFGGCQRATPALDFFDSALDRTSVPACKQDAETELAVVRVKLQIGELWLKEGEPVKDYYRIDDKTYRALKSDLEAGLVKGKARVKVLEAAIPALPDCQQGATLP